MSLLGLLAVALGPAGCGDGSSARDEGLRDLAARHGFSIGTAAHDEHLTSSADPEYKPSSRASSTRSRRTPR